MRPNLFPTLSFLLITSILVHIPVSFCQDNEKYNKCGESIKCGSLNIGYPFYGEGRPEECGFPGFELNCESDVPLITSGSVTYRVLSVDDATQTLTVARNDLWDNLCPTNLYNTTLDFNIFTYTTNDQNITMYYGCSLIPGVSFSPPNQFCTNGNNFAFYLTMNESFTKYAAVVACNNHITVPVYLEAYQIIENINSSADDLTRALEGGFELEWFAENENCSQCTKSSGRCGNDPVSNSFVCYCPDGRYINGTNGFICNNTQTGSGSKRKLNPAIIIIIAALVGTSAITMFSITALYRCRGRCFLLSGYWNMDRRNDQNIEAFVRNWGSLAPKQYSYSEIKKITNSFREKLGQGGYGSVYKGKLPDGRLVAVKVLKETKGGNGEEFINEVSSISRTSHVNVVTLLGFCYNRKRALIYEFMPNGSLDKFIYKSGSPNADFHLEWKKLYQIVVGIARGLEYLHRGCNTRIVHFDIKPHNILLDEDFCPKISDFGLAKLSEKKESILSMSTARGTVGYIAPEVIFRQFGGVSHKSDVYGYGMMILEMVGVRKYAGEVYRSSDVYFPQWIYEHFELGKELNIQAVTGKEEEEMSRKMILVGLWCIQTSPSDRPSIGKAVEMLEGSLQSLQIPPKPFLNSPKRSPQHSSASFSGGYEEERNFLPEQISKEHSPLTLSSPDNELQQGKSY